METAQVLDMILQTLRGMLIGLPGVFAVLAVFYFALKLFMSATTKQKEE